VIAPDAESKRRLTPVNQPPTIPTSNRPELHPL
jgi:hypothetical protein